MKHRMCAMAMDENGRSYTSHTDVPMKKVGDLEYISEKQDGSYWGLSFNQNTPLTNEYEMHLTNHPRIVGVMSGHAEIMQQDGSVCRLATGDFIFVDPLALHHSIFRSPVPTQTLSLTFPATDKKWEFK
jgi:hypothetical protein